MLETLGADDFAPHVKTSFDLVDFEGFSIELISVEERKNIPGQAAFTLTFSIPIENAIQQGTYRMSHSVLGNGDIFLVPVAQIDGQLHCEAAFSRLKS